MVICAECLKPIRGASPTQLFHAHCARKRNNRVSCDRNRSTTVDTRRRGGGSGPARKPVTREEFKGCLNYGDIMHAHEGGMERLITDILSGKRTVTG